MKGFRGKLGLGWLARRFQAMRRNIEPNHNLAQKEQDHIEDHIDSTNIKPQVKSRRIRIGAITAVLTIGMFLAGYQYVQAHTVTYYHVMINDEEIGAIENEEQLLALYERKKQEYAQKYPQADMVVNTKGITTVEAKKYKAKIDAEATLAELEGRLTGYSKGVELQVDGKTIAIVKDQAIANAILEQVKGKYIPDTTSNNAPKFKLLSSNPKNAAKSTGSDVTIESAVIVEDVTQVAVKADPNKVLGAEEALQRIMEGSEAAITYTVREGDTISSIAKRYGVTQKEVFANNPGVQEKTLQIGTELNVRAMKPALTVKTVELMSEEIVTEPEVIIQKNADMQAGKSKVIAEGQSGLKVMEYRLTKENGEVVAEEWLGQEVIKASSPRIIMKGTKVIGEGSGQFAWPVSGARMTSSYGKRWGRTHKGIDLVSSNRNILAADEGVVSFAGTKSGYGNVIIINHNNGFETLYGHLSKISVEKGDIVEKGDKIGVMGSTGRSTGTHLHFEIHKNGTVQNPMKYL
ncbi:peptidoglycan DD-metalloendopeptidase family protein [Paenibacillus lentus]|uniref:LysM peptidoglycan-binding domain-containing protein n=1 Tax=Paenibacillus lentus TaxID=1338368 RepID=A0A3Q8S3Z1_9BACL|nr:peptidoglycan DD-metalloendopeptidase family protein [Paenibacillus lentus]AZK45614.1 LysM peptidoglycan-binding domain-containing protein [Paenibacillus lentus]